VRFPDKGAEEAMKKALVGTALLVLLGSWSYLAAGRADSSSLDADLIEAATQGDTAAVRQFLQKGANIETKEIGRLRKETRP
jgi:hypothetical protein